ncbi:Uncharacterised protein [Mycobacteroides abscessus subsp. abscessus]|nr:Uncharacterised protein [Mycobacteroides abscessus subsp. abscessus]
MFAPSLRIRATTSGGAIKNIFAALAYAFVGPVVLAGCVVDTDRIATETINEKLEERRSASSMPSTSAARANKSKLLGVDMPTGTWLVQSSYSGTSSREAWGYKGDRLDSRKDIPIRNTIFAMADSGLLRQGWQQCTIHTGGPYSWIKPGTDEYIIMSYMAGPPKIANVLWQNWHDGACEGRVKG